MLPQEPKRVRAAIAGDQVPSRPVRDEDPIGGAVDALVEPNVAGQVPRDDRQHAGAPPVHFGSVRQNEVQDLRAKPPLSRPFGEMFGNAHGRLHSYPLSDCQTQ